MTDTTGEAGVGQPTGGPTSVAAVKLRLGIDLDDTTDDKAIDEVVDAVNDYVRGLPIAQHESGSWRGRIRLGATMLAARLYRRKDSPDGVATFAGDAAVYVQRNDPDVATMLGLGSANQRPAVG